MEKQNLDIKEIHSRLRKLRESTETQNKNEVSQRELGERIGVAHSRISKLENENDQTIPSFNDLLAYRNYFNVSIDYLLGLEKIPTTNEINREITKEIGLSDNSINKLKRLQDSNYLNDDHIEIIKKANLEIMTTFNKFIESRSFEDFIYILHEFYNFDDYTGAYRYFLEDINGESVSGVFNHEVVDFLFLQKIIESIKQSKQ